MLATEDSGVQLLMTQAIWQQICYMLTYVCDVNMMYLERMYFSGRKNYDFDNENIHSQVAPDVKCKRGDMQKSHKTRKLKLLLLKM